MVVVVPKPREELGIKAKDDLFVQLSTKLVCSKVPSVKCNFK